ncbi:MAG: AbrB/MazE/SpoVT family DNA-binding domain-containing protein [Candidatus Rokubacteria bacterium]|nr:AbrB/MazE/SpoVT family DNA-binding domain-containing protein [Candidatus Rokubacteria bacterium]
MDSAKLSTKFQLVVPRGPRERLGLRPGMTFTVFDKGGILVLVPQRPPRAYRGIARGATPRDLREKKDRL